MSNYPAQIDNGSSLPIAIDNLTPVQGSVFNALRNAVLAVESTLGTQPNGVYGSVANRLTTLEGTVGGIVEISLAGDLGNNLATPHVIGIQGRPVNSMAPTFGQVLVWNGIVWTPSSVGGDLSGPFTHQTVIGIQGNPVSNVTPTAGQFLVENAGATGSAWASLSGDVTNSITTPGAITVTSVQGNTFTAGTPIKGQFVVATSTSNYGPVTVTGDISESPTTPGLLTVVGIQGNTITSGALVEGDLLIATSTSNWAPTAVTGDVSFSNSFPGNTTVTAIQNNAITSGPLTKGQFLVASSGGFGTSTWTPITLSGDISASIVTPGAVTVTGLVGSTVPTPTEPLTLLTWNGTTMDWSLPVNTVGPQSAFQHGYGQFLNVGIQPALSVPGLIPVTSSSFTSYSFPVADPTKTGFFGQSVWFAGINNLTRIDDNSFNISQIPLDDLPGFASFTTVPDIIATTVGPQPGIINYTKLYAFDAELGLLRVNNVQGSFGVEANLPVSAFGGNAPTSIHFDSYALAGTFTITNGLAAVTVDTSQTGVVSAGNHIIFGSQTAIYTVLTIDGTGKNITLTAPYTGVTPPFGTSAAVNNNQIILWFPFYNSVSTLGTLYFVSPDFTSITSLLVSTAGITGGFVGWESGATATYANGTIFMLAEGLAGSVIWAVGVNTLTHAVTHNIASTATSVIGSPGNTMVFSQVNNKLYLADNGVTSTIYTLSVTSNTQTASFSTGISISGLAINDGSITLPNDELAAITSTSFYLYHNLAGTLVSNGAPVVFSNLPSSTPFFGLYKYFSPPDLNCVILDPAGGENFTGGPAYWVTDFNNNVVYNLAANLNAGVPIAPALNQLLQPGTSVSWQPGPFTSLNIGVGDSPYATTTFDHYLIVDTSSGDVDITLTSGVPGTNVVIMDGTGEAASTGNIIISASATINGSGSPVVIATNWGVKTFVFNGSTWNAY